MNSPKLAMSPKLGASGPKLPLPPMSPRLRELKKYHISDKLQTFHHQVGIPKVMYIHLMGVAVSLKDDFAPHLNRVRYAKQKRCSHKCGVIS